MDTFKKNLEEFAYKHKDEIRRDANFRKQFQDMCANIGVDPLSTSKGFWSEMLVKNIQNKYLRNNLFFF